MLCLFTALSACSAVSCQAPERFASYTVFVENHSDGDRFVYLSDSTEPLPNFAYVERADGVVRRSGEINLGSLDAQGVGGWVLVFDAECHELHRAPIGSGNYRVQITQQSMTVVPVEKAALPTGVEALAGTPMVCGH